jgi:hypothetical protein
MAVGISSYSANAFFNALGNNTSFAVAQAYIQLHTADPGSAGTTAVATETTRKSVSFGAASGGAISNDADISWSNINGSQDATHFTLWDASSNGNFLGSGTITANAYTAGDTYTIPSGDLDLSLTIAS